MNIDDLPLAPGAAERKSKRTYKASDLAKLEKRLKKLKENTSGGKKASCTRMGTKLAQLINESNKLGKKAQEIEKQIDALALKIQKEGDVCEFSKKK